MTSRSEVKSLRPRGGIDRSLLVELGSNPDVQAFVIGVVWKGEGTPTDVSWSDGMTMSQLAFLRAHIDNEIERCLFP